MSRAATVLRAPGLVLRLDASGTVVSASGSTDAGPVWLVGTGGLVVTTTDGPCRLGPPVVTVDADEVEVERPGGGLRTWVRHAVEQAWTVRLVLANESGAEVALEQVRLGWQAAPGCVATVLAAGARAAYAVQRADGDGPLLVGRLRSGAQPDVDETGLLLGPLVLPPQRRATFSWRWEVAPDPRRAAGGTDLPGTTWLDLGQVVVLPAGPDVAVVAPDLVVELEDDRAEVAGWAPGTSVVELRSARGTTTFALTAAPDLDDLVDVDVLALLAGPTTPGGTVRLAGAAGGLVVQDALARRSVAAPDELGDALELLAGRLVEDLDDPAPAGGVDAMTVAFLAREADRTGGAFLLDAAARCFLRTTVAVPGLGIAGTGLALARVRAGAGAADLVAHLLDLGRVGTAQHDAALELALLLRAPAAVADEPVLAGLRRLGATLGAGLAGRVLPARPLDEVAYASALLGLVDEATGQRLRQGWGVTASELARRTAAEARARLHEEPGPDGRRALAWLVLGRR